MMQFTYVIASFQIWVHEFVDHNKTISYLYYINYSRLKDKNFLTDGSSPEDDFTTIDKLIKLLDYAKKVIKFACKLIMAPILINSCTNIIDTPGNLSTKAS